MTYLSISLVGGLVWIGLRGKADLATFCVGVAISAVALGIARFPRGGFVSPVRWARGAVIVGRIAVRFGIDLVVANVRQLRLVLSPRLRPRPRWIRFTTRLEHPASRVLLGVLISLTPGTVTEDLRGADLFVHALDAGPDDDPVAEIRERFESLLVELEAL